MASRHATIERAFVALITAHDRLHRGTGISMKPWGVTGPQYNVLRILKGAGFEGKRSQAIAEDMISKVPDVTRLVDRLEAAGLAERRADPGDRRAVRVVITDKGTGLLERMEKPIRKLHEQVLGDLDDRELGVLTELLIRIRSAE